MSSSYPSYGVSDAVTFMVAVMERTANYVQLAHPAAEVPRCQRIATGDEQRLIPGAHLFWSA